MNVWLYDFGAGWLALATAFALHVADEASHDFLAWYNPIALRIRRFTGPLRFPPVFTFWPWLIGLGALTALLFALTPWAYDRRAILRLPAIVFGLINIGNALLHLSASILMRRLVPGTLSAPLLFGASLWLIFAAVRL